MPWWGWILIVIVVLILFALWSGRAKGKYGNEEDFRVSARPFIDRATEYRRIALAEASHDKDKLQKIEEGLDWELREFLKWAAMSGVAETESAINGAKLIESYKNDVREMMGLPPLDGRRWRQ